MVGQLLFNKDSVRECQTKIRYEYRNWNLVCLSRFFSEVLQSTLTEYIDYKSFDAIIGYRADDSYFSFAQDFINGTISYRQLNNAMYLGKLGHQFVLKSKKAFDRIRFVGSEIAESREWYAKKMLRDKTARREYFTVERNRRQRGDLYITQIMDEEMMPDDPRLR